MYILLNSMYNYTDVSVILSLLNNIFLVWNMINISNVKIVIYLYK